MGAAHASQAKWMGHLLMVGSQAKGVGLRHAVSQAKWGVGSRGVTAGVMPPLIAALWFLAMALGWSLGGAWLSAPVLVSLLPW